MLAQAVAGLLLLDATASVAFAHSHGRSHFGRSEPPHLIKFGRGVNDTVWLSVDALDRLHDAVHGGSSTLASIKYDPLFKDVDQRAIDALTMPKFGCGPGLIDLSDAGQEKAQFVPAGATTRFSSKAFPKPASANYPELQSMFAQVSSDGLTSIIAALSTNFTTRYYRSAHARDSALWIQNQFEAIVGKEDVSLIENSAFDQPNVIAAIPAAEGSTNKEIIVLGAHLDSINQHGGGAAPGADDDASGIAVLMQTLKILKASGYRGKRRIEVQAYAGEEGGLLGSINTAAKYAADGKAVRAMLQMDMIGYQPASKPIITMLDDDDIDAGIQTFIKGILDVYVPEATYRTAKCNYACSDHYSFIENGFPAGSINEAGPDVGLNPAYHSANDTLDKLNMKHGSVFVKASLAFALEASERADTVSQPTASPTTPTTTGTEPIPTADPVPSDTDTEPNLPLPTDTGSGDETDTIPTDDPTFPTETDTDFPGPEPTDPSDPFPMPPTSPGNSEPDFPGSDDTEPGEPGSEEPGSDDACTVFGISKGSLPSWWPFDIC